jgi:magnesium chelatase family protein
LFGGGRPFRPGEISLAHGGILFLDELAEFRRDALEALREPLETGWVQPARLQSRFVMPARTQLVAAMNPCPCGLFGTVRAHSTPCRCTPKQVQAYRAKLSAPLLDRFDLIVLMQTASPAPVLPVQAAVPLASSARVSQVLGKDWTAAEAQAAVRAARDLARARQSVLNAHLSEGALQRLPVQPGALMLLNQLARTASWSRRVLGRFQRVARTIADLQGMEAIDEACLAEAVSLRRGLQIDDGMPA